MTSLGDLLYGLAVRAFRALVPPWAPEHSKLARGMAGRRGADLRLRAWAGSSRNPDRRLAWFHAPSVGEGLQARAVLEALLERRPDLQAAFTFFSPSAESLARRMPVDVSDYLPWDLPGEVGPVLDAVRPGLLAFTKTEVWPILAREAARRDVPTVLIAATLPPGAGRLRLPARWYLRRAFGRLRAVAAISADDGKRFSDGLGVPPERIVVTGDPGIDSAWSRVRTADAEAAYLRPFLREPAPTLVAGSTWPPDEQVLLPACRAIRTEVSGLRLILAPHEPTEDRLVSLEDALLADGWSAGRLGALEERGEVGGADAVIVDRVGVLAQLYTVGTAAYVGGGFHDEGLHSVLEPAAAGLPVAFGPRHANARAAADLLARKAASEAESADGLARVLGRWLTDEAARGEAGARASGYIQEHRGAAARTADLLLEILGGG